MDCFEGIKSDTRKMYIGSMPTVDSEEHRKVEVPRYSYRKDEKMVLRGIEGKQHLSGVSKELLPFLLAGEIIHVGKYTSFGFGRYRISSDERNSQYSYK